MKPVVWGWSAPKPAIGDDLALRMYRIMQATAGSDKTNNAQIIDL